MLLSNGREDIGTCSRFGCARCIEVNDLIGALQAPTMEIPTFAAAWKQKASLLIAYLILVNRVRFVGQCTIAATVTGACVQIFEAAAPLIRSAVQGYNATIFACTPTATLKMKPSYMHFQMDVLGLVKRTPCTALLKKLVPTTCVDRYDSLSQRSRNCSKGYNCCL